MTGLVREKMQVIDQQQKDLQGLKGEIELLKQAAVIADKRSKELAKWREKAALLAKLESVVRESAQSEKVKAEQLSQVKLHQCSESLSGTHKPGVCADERPPIAVRKSADGRGCPHEHQDSTN